MARTTYYVALPFVRSGKGRLIPGEASPAQDEGHAKRMAAAMGSRLDRYAGAVAFSRTGDPDFGDWDDAKIIASFGEVEAELAAA